MYRLHTHMVVANVRCAPCLLALVSVEPKGFSRRVMNMSAHAMIDPITLVPSSSAFAPLPNLKPLILMLVIVEDSWLVTPRPTPLTCTLGHRLLPLQTLEHTTMTFTIKCNHTQALQAWPQTISTARKVLL